MPAEDELYTVQCYRCEGEFPKVVSVNPDKHAKGARSLEATCPYCDAELSILLDQPLAMNNFFLKSQKKVQ